MEKEIIWTPKSIDAFRGHYSYIENDSPLNADRFEAKVFEIIDLVSLNPFMGRMTIELKDEMVREVLIYGTFRIIYEIFEDRIEILTIRRTAQANDFQKNDN
ncbi:MAG: type II toxin-antitoxin system RelE/ParE family toxin [Arcicella sp.]|nr:type II toxin-antitoxin system RelE/ParE family toxin [Arcicella sp.]